MAGYIIATYNITDEINYQRYIEQVKPTLEAYNGEVLVADYCIETLEGTPPHVAVVIRFVNKATAREWYQSTAYQNIIHLRTNTTVGNAVLTDAYEYLESRQTTIIGQESQKIAAT